MTSKREEVAMSAASAMADFDSASGGEATMFQLAEVAQAVFEQAHTPTDDEREAAGALAEYDRSQPSDYERAYAEPLADALRALLRHATALRRPVQGEPTPVRFVARQGGKTQAVIESMLAQANESGIRVEVVYPQGEPTDAQVLAALNSFYQHEWTGHMSDWSTPNRQAMRRALRAAAAVTEQGENR